MQIKKTLKADTFKYPSKEERKKINKSTPKINRLKFDYKSSIIAILQGTSLENAIRNEDIPFWNNCLDNRLGKLTETYVYVQTHFKRFQQKSANENTDAILLDYYIEIFYYYYFSARDVLGQLLNVVYDLKSEEHEIYFNNKFIEKINFTIIKEALLEFLRETKDSYKIRNFFNHRFTPIH